MQLSSINNSNNIQNLLGGFSASSKSDNQNEKKDEAYQLSISDEAQAAYAAAKRSQANRINNPDLGASLPKELQESIKSMQDKLNRILLSHNIKTGQDLNFTVNNEGKIELVGENPNKEAIEEALNSDAEFVKEAKSTLEKASAEAQSQVNQKKEIRLKEPEDDEEEKKKQNEYERQLAINTKAISVANQINTASNKFSVSGGTISFDSLNIAQSTVF